MIVFCNGRVHYVFDLVSFECLSARVRVDLCVGFDVFGSLLREMLETINNKHIQTPPNLNNFQI